MSQISVRQTGMVFLPFPGFELEEVENSGNYPENIYIHK